MEITPELDRLISLLAEAKMRLLVAAATPKESPDRAENMAVFERCTKKARKQVESMGGYEKVPQHLAVEVRACELGVERLGGPKAPPMTPER